MSTVAEKLRHVRRKTERAQKHILDLEAELAAFFKTNPYRVAVKHDPQTRKLVYYLVGVDPIPDVIALIAGDAIQNLATTLDHLAFQLVWSDSSGTPAQPGRIYFPIADDRTKYEASKSGKMQGASSATLVAIDALQPYKGGNDLIWMLQRLNNIEKHRLLFTVGSQIGGIDLADLMIGNRFQTNTTNPMVQSMIQGLRGMAIQLNPADRGFPLKVGDELLIGGIEEQPNMNQKFRFDVAISEVGVAEGKPLLQTVHELATAVESVVVALTPILRDTA